MLPSRFFSRGNQASDARWECGLVNESAPFRYIAEGPLASNLNICPNVWIEHYSHSISTLSPSSLFCNLEPILGWLTSPICKQTTAIILNSTTRDGPGQHTFRVLEYFVTQHTSTTHLAHFFHIPKQRITWFTSFPVNQPRGEVDHEVEASLEMRFFWTFSSGGAWSCRKDNKSWEKEKRYQHAGQCTKSDWGASGKSAPKRMTTNHCILLFSFLSMMITLLWI